LFGCTHWDAENLAAQADGGKNQAGEYKGRKYLGFHWVISDLPGRVAHKGERYRCAGYNTAEGDDANNHNQGNRHFAAGIQWLLRWF
jgi:hypothetical protein